MINTINKIKSHELESDKTLYKITLKRLMSYDYVFVIATDPTSAHEKIKDFDQKTGYIRKLISIEVIARENNDVDKMLLL